MGTVRCGLALACCVGAAEVAVADGGRVCASAITGDYRITLFVQPTPARVGDAEITVLVQDAASDEVLPDVDVLLRVRTADGASPAKEAAAVSGVAENRLLRGASLSFAAPGEAVVEAELAGTSVVGVRCVLAVEAAAPPLLAWWPLLALPPVVVALFVANRLLAERQRARRRGASRAPSAASSHDAW